MTAALRVGDLHAGVGNVRILKGVDLEVPFGEVHALMGPNGSGKSTLCHVLMGKDEFDAEGSAAVDGTELLGLGVDERARAGLFEAFQYDQALPLLDRLIQSLSPGGSVQRPDLLVQALELRARSRFALADAQGAEQDFSSLLTANPSFRLAAKCLPRA